MALVFTPCSGAVGIVREGCSDTDNFFLSVAGGGSDLIDSAIITSMSLELSGNYQFLHTLNDFIYAYSFGDRIGTLNVSGVGFARACSGGKGALLKTYEWYKTNRISRATQILTIVIRDSESSGTFLGFLTGMRLDASSGENDVNGLGHWSMRFELIPEN
jgi:hypothetical protein